VRRPEYTIDDRVARALARLDGDPDLPIAALAAEVGLSRGRLATLFRLGVGTTPTTYAGLARVTGAGGAAETAPG
jgi:AraC-like DNA-binding protein